MAERVAKGKKVRSSHLEKKQDVLVVIDDEFNRLREDMESLRGDLEGSEAYVYTRTAPHFKMIRTRAARRDLPLENLVARDKAATKAVYQHTANFQKRSSSNIFPANLASTDEGVTVHESIDSKLSPDDPGSNTKRKSFSNQDQEARIKEMERYKR